MEDASPSTISPSAAPGHACWPRPWWRRWRSPTGSCSWRRSPGGCGAGDVAPRRGGRVECYHEAPPQEVPGNPMILLIDNYDSFTYNLVQRLGEMDRNVDLRVFRNDKITPDEVAELKPTHLIVSPGPCTPKEAGVSNEIIKRFAATIPILGVCLGHQCIGHVFGGN